MTELKAYRCTSGDEEHAGIEFAATSGKARQQYARVSGDDYMEVSARREKRYDRHAPGPVPIRELVEDGWWFECHSCERRVSSEEGFIEDASPEKIREVADLNAPRIAALARFDRENPRPDVPKQDTVRTPEGRRAYYDAASRRDEWRRSRYELECRIIPTFLSRAGIRTHDAAGIVYCDARCEQDHAARRAAVNHEHAEAEREAQLRWPGAPSYTSQRWPYLTPQVVFHPPGLQHDVQWSPDKTHVFLHKDDRDAWNAFSERCRKTEDENVAA